jgi:hypothetical protein
MNEHASNAPGAWVPPSPMTLAQMVQPFIDDIRRRYPTAQAKDAVVLTGMALVLEGRAMGSELPELDFDALTTPAMREMWLDYLHGFENILDGVIAIVGQVTSGTDQPLGALAVMLEAAAARAHQRAAEARAARDLC